jgi:hypothetical protein
MNKKLVISSTVRNGKTVAQMSVYQSQNHSVTKHERVFEDDKGNLKILSRKKS